MIHLEITSDGPEPWRSKVKINGVEFLIVALQLDIRGDQLNAATITFEVDKLTVDAETSAKLVAFIAAQEANGPSKT